MAVQKERAPPDDLPNGAERFFLQEFFCKDHTKLEYRLIFSAARASLHYDRAIRFGIRTMYPELDNP